MSRNPLALSIAAALIAACAASPPAQPASSAPPTPTSSPAAVPTSSPPATSPAASPAPSLPAAWPEGVAAHEAGLYADVPGYLEYLPRGYADDDEPRPMLVFLHGAGENGAGSEAELQKVLKLGIPQMIAEGTWPGEHPFVVLMPQYPQAEAEGECALADEIDRLLRHALLSYRIDPQAIYLTGISCGAIGIWDYLAQAEDNLVAAAVPIAGHPVWAMEKAGCELARTPTWTFHGAQDEVVPVNYVEDSIAELRACTDPPPSELELTIYPDADHFENDAWTRTYDLSAGHDVYAWLLDHRAEGAQ